MTQPIRFLFDECLLAGPEVRNHLSESLRLFGANAEIVFFFCKFPLGTKDRIWIPQIAAEGGWIVVTCDRGKKSGSGDKLPEICAAYGVTHIMLSRAMARHGWYQKTLAFESHWREMIAAADAPPGTGFSIYPAGEASSAFRKVSDPHSAPRPADSQRQQTLFDSTSTPDAPPQDVPPSATQD